ncbi:hypothetical protein BDY24DRAFT_378101 [Mrakia frigida]|uniref:uncharacterized protein n=1 Tax=Mrakia frigida TaxID=29902 RepID=UPI003FCBF388
MSKLFCTRNPLLHQPHLEPNLSLHQIRHCTLSNAEADQKGPWTPSRFSQDRFLGRLHVATLSLRIRGAQRSTHCLLGPWSRLITLFDPVEVTFSGIMLSRSTHLLPEVDLRSFSWASSLRLLRLRNCVVAYSFTAFTLEIEQALSTGPGVIVVFDLSSRSGGQSSSLFEEDAVKEVYGFWGTRLVDRPGVKEVVICGSSRAQLERMKVKLVDEVGFETFDGWQSRLKFEVVGRDDEVPAPI